MSRLQKKKPAVEKKKKKVVKQGESDRTGGASAFSSGKTTAGAVSRSKTDKVANDAKSREPNFFQKNIEFLREVKVELSKVTWPTRKQTGGTTVVVIVFVFVVAGFLGLFDLGLSKLVQLVLT